MSDDGAPRDAAPEETAGPGGPQEPRPRSANLVLVAAGVILVGLVAYALSRRPAALPAAAAPAGEATPPLAGTTIAAVAPFHLSPEASIVAERYRCVCGCGDLLNVCTCSKTPGSNDMKRALQDLVNQKRGPEEIDRAMVEKFGPQVLLANRATPTPSPAPRRRR